MRIFGGLAGGLAAVLALAGVLGATQTAQAAQAKAAAPPNPTAQSAVIANATTGAWLWSRTAFQKRPMGSITKVMTALIVIDDGNLSQRITVPSGIIGYDGAFNASTAGLAPGEKLTALQLLYALMLPSGCDAAYTLATAYGGGNRTAFIAAMNRMAKHLGLTRTHFNDFSGLPVGGDMATHSDARDLVVLGRDAMKLAMFRQIVATRYYNVASGNGHDKHSWTNLNQLLFTYSGAIGIKTGQTTGSGPCLLFEARRGNKTLIGVVLHSKLPPSGGLNYAFSDAAMLLTWGFSQ